MFASKVLLPLAAVLCFIASSEAIKCYKCSSYSDLNCAKAELLKSSSMANVVDCDLDRRPSYAQSGMAATKCVYMTLKDTAGVVVKRDCHWESDMQQPDKCNPGVNNVDITDCKICKGDYCNSGTRMALGITSLAALFMALKVFC